MENNPNIIPFPQMIPERTLKSGSGSSVTVVRELGSGKRFIYRCFIGSPEVYRKLLGVRCRHLPNILDVIQTGDTIHVLEEYIEGDTLAFLLEGCTLSPAIAKQIILELCRALKVLHEIGAVHRDIKPENVMIRGSEAVLIDFDASRLFKENCTTDTRIMGTTGYAAPEQYGFSQTGPRADIYSLGILLNEILTNEHPSRVLAEGKLRPIIEKCTQINADRRYADIQELSNALTRRRTVKSPVKTLRAVGITALGIILLFGIVGLIRLLSASKPDMPEQLPQTTTSETEYTPEITAETIPETTAEKVPTTTEAELSCKISTSIERWTGPVVGQATNFSCDLNGDGQDEHYIYGIRMSNMPYAPNVYHDACTSGPGAQHHRDFYPAFWLVKEDGTTQMDRSLTEHITDVQVTFWRVDDLRSVAPRCEIIDDLRVGYANAVFVPSQSGTWVIEMKITLFGQELTATYICTFIYEPMPK